MDNSCLIYARQCEDCGECDICDLDNTKRCDNCGACIDEINDYRTVTIEEFLETQEDEEKY